jgi:hypothetical protein
MNKGNSIWRGKFKVGCLRTQLKFFLKGLIEFNEGLIAIKLTFWVNLGSK